MREKDISVSVDVSELHALLGGIEMAINSLSGYFFLSGCPSSGSDAPVRSVPWRCGLSY